jgi:hypothetical protein
MHDLVGRVDNSVVSVGQHRGAPSPGALGVLGSSPALLAYAGGGAEDQARATIEQEPRARTSR